MQTEKQGVLLFLSDTNTQGNRKDKASVTCVDVEMLVLLEFLLLLLLCLFPGQFGPLDLLFSLLPLLILLYCLLVGKHTEKV